MDIANDTAVVGLGEAHRGAGIGYNIVTYITVSTGVGGTRIVDGRIDRRIYGFEPGHQTIDIDNSVWEGSASGQLEDLPALDRGVELPIEVLERLGISKHRRLHASAHESIRADRQLILEDQFQELHMIEPVAGGCHARQNGRGGYGLELQIVLALDIRANGDEVIASARLHAVAGEVKQPDAALTQRVAEGADGPAHGGVVGIGQQGHGEPGFFQSGGHGQGTVHQ